MSRTDLSSLFNQLEALTVGFGPVFRDFQNLTPSYPPHNILRVSDKEFDLELAVAGFKKSEIEMQMHDGVLTIRADKAISADPDVYQYRGIAARSFSKSFRIAEYFEVAGAKLEDGVLSVKFIKNIPDEAKPKLIPIS